MNTKIKKEEMVIPKFVNEMYNNWEIFLQQMGGNFERDYKYEMGKDEVISCIGLSVKLTNPKTNKQFSIIISDDLLESGEVRKRLNYGNKVCGDLTKVGEWLDKRKSSKDRIENNLKNEKPIQIDLLNGVEYNKEHSETFHIPSDEKKSKVNVGDCVKVVDNQYGERFWVIVKDFISDELMVGEINNELVGNQPYSLGDKIFLTMDNIIDVLDDDYKKYVKENYPNLLDEGTFDENDNNDEINFKL
jgi:hypothetical protein